MHDKHNGRQLVEALIAMDRLVPGTRVRHPTEPDWGVGQVQSVIGQRVTVNFENAGKLLIDAAVVQLIPIDDTPLRR
jgi:transcription elongation factor GreA-like protein